MAVFLLFDWHVLHNATNVPETGFVKSNAGAGKRSKANNELMVVTIVYLLL